MGQLGADVDELERLGQGFAREGSRVTGSRDRLHAALAGVAWLGPDADRFRSDWRATMSPALGRLAEALREQSVGLQRQARDQRSASESGGVMTVPVAHVGGLRQQPQQPPATDERGQTLDDILRRYQVADGEVVEWEPPWPESLATDPIRITEQEASMLDDIGTFGRLDFKDIRDAAYDTADDRYPDQGAEDGHNDAFRHTYWNALMTQRFGEQWAKDFSTAHEQVPGNNADREAMDLYNNELGRRIASENPDASPEELADLVQEAIENGDAVVIDEDGDLAFSDQVAPGETGDADDGPANGGQQPNPDDDSDWAGGYNPGGADDDSGTTTSGQ